MKLPAVLASRALDVIDIAFEAANALWRVVLRGAYTGDARSYSGARFAQLAGVDVLAQEVAINAADQAEAKKAIALDADRVLPLAPDLVLFDVAGPLEAEARPRARPEQSYLLGVVRKDALERLRSGLPPMRRGVEAFVFAPPAHKGLALLFEDEPGRRRRRLRRALTALALLALGLTATDLVRAGAAALERQLAAADAERLGVERRIRLAERRVREAESARAAMAQTNGPHLAEVSERLSQIALHQPAEAELSAVTLARHTLSLSGRAYAPDAAELALRRAFEGDEIGFSTQDGEAPQGFTAELTLQPQVRP